MKIPSVLGPVACVFFAAVASGASVDGIELHWTPAGQGQQAVVFVHGWTCADGASDFTLPPMTGESGLAAREGMIRGMFSEATTPELRQRILSMMLGAPDATAWYTRSDQSSQQHRMNDPNPDHSGQFLTTVTIGPDT